MKKWFCMILMIALITGTTACVSSESGSDESPAPDMSATSEISPTPDISPASGISAGEEAIAGASTADELRTLIASYIQDENYTAALHAADKLLELDPSDESAYAAKAELCILTIKNGYDALNSLLAEAVGKVSDPTGYKEQIRQMYDGAGLELVIPFVSDYTSPDEVNTVGTSAGNLSCCVIEPDFSSLQYGVFATQGEWIYFSEHNEAYALYKMRLDSRERQLVCADGAANLNIIGDWIYFSNVGDNNTLYKIRTDGSMKTKLADDRCDSLCVSGDWIFYLNADDGDTVYRIRTDGSEREPFFKQAGTLFIDGDWLYFTAPDEGSVMRIRLDGTDDQLLLEGQWYTLICIHNGWLYYRTDVNGLIIMRMSPDGSTEPEEVWRYDAKINFFTFTNDRMIVSVRSLSNVESILVLDLDTMEQLLKIDAATDCICTAGGDDVFFVDASDFSWYKLMWDSGAAERAY